MLSETERLGLKLLRRDKEALRRLAGEEGETMSVLVRRLIREEAQRRGLLEPTDEERQEQETRIQKETQDQVLSKTLSISG